MKRGRSNLDAIHRRWVREWWMALQPRKLGDPPPKDASLATFDRGTRARLRRCKDADELLSDPAALVLADRLIRNGSDRWPLVDEPDTHSHVALAAGVLVRIKRDQADGKTLALHLGQPAQGSERPVMSEIRFRRLQDTRSPVELLLQWQRAVQLVEATDVAQLADDLLTWLAELGLPFGRGSDSVKFRWAYDYYLAARDRAAAKDPVSDEEINP